MGRTKAKTNEGGVWNKASPGRTKRKNISKSSSVAYPLVAAVLSGFICFNLGKLFSSGSERHQLMTSDDVDTSQSSTTYYYGDGADPDSPAYYRGSIQKTIIDSYDDSSIDIKFAPTDRRFVQRPSTPYNCGVIFFYHIPSTGGASINWWFKKFNQPRFGNVSYYQYWALETRKDGSFHPDPERCEAEFNRGMDRQIRGLGPNEWRIAHTHLTCTYLNESEDLLYKWRSIVESQGCELINTVMLRDPLNHAMSLHKIIKSKNSTREVWTKFLSSSTGTGLWSTVLDFFLYNTQGLRYHVDYPFGIGGRNPFNVTKEVKVARALELLHRHFDIVTIGDHATFMGKILDWTGLSRANKYRRSNTFQGELNFTKKEVENLVKLLQKNGDIEFVDQVRHDYYDYLSYLDD